MSAAALCDHLVDHRAPPQSERRAPRPGSWVALRIRRPGVALAVTMLAAQWLAGVAGAADLEIRSRWTAGERQVLSLERRRERTGGTRAGSVVSRSEVSIAVLEANPHGYVVRWTLGAPQIEATRDPDRPLVEELGKLLADLTYDLELSAAGEVKSLRNWLEVRARGESAMTAMLEGLRKRGLPEAAVSGVRQQLAGLFASEEQLLSHGMPEARLYYAMHGRTLRAGAPSRYATTLPSPAGGEGIPSRGEIALRSLDPGSGRAVIAWTRTADPAAATRAMRRMLTELAVRMGRPAPAPGDLPRLKQAERGEHVIDSPTGWVTSLTHVRETTTTGTTGSATRIDSLVLTERTRSASTSP